MNAPDKTETIRLPRIMIAAPASGSGKTLITCSLLRILQRKGIRAAAFKCGPDYIDPMFHRKVLHTPSRNLDLYLAGEEGVLRSLAAGCREAGVLQKDGAERGAWSGTADGIAVIEGVMGYYDGTGPSGMTGSSYHLAKVTKTPVILAADARGMSRSAAALIRGFSEYGEERLIRGALLNKVSPSMADTIGGWTLEESGIPVLGSLRRDGRISLESRHLGLVQPSEIPAFLNRIDLAADMLEETLDLQALLDIANAAPPLPAGPDADFSGLLRAAGIPAPGGADRFVLAVARDEAFSFSYEDNLDLLRGLGAEIVFFSPLQDPALPGADGLLLGGGYPELWGKELEDNGSMRESIRTAAGRGMPVLAECGGFQYLQKTLEDAQGRTFAMAGVLEGGSFMTDRLVRFGYAAFTPAQEAGAGYLQPGHSIRGHEFHYSDSTANGRVCRAAKPNGRTWNCMALRGRIMAGYPHLYYPSDPVFAQQFAAACRAYRKERQM